MRERVPSAGTAGARRVRVSCELSCSELCQHTDIANTVKLGDRLAQFAGAGRADDWGGERVELFGQAAALVGDVRVGDARIEFGARRASVLEPYLDRGTGFGEILAEIEAHPLA